MQNETPKIRPLRREDGAALEEICFLTGFWYPEERLRRLGSLKWVLPYVDHETEHGFAAEADGRIVGYVLSTPDVRRFETEIEPLYAEVARKLLAKLPRGKREFWEGFFRDRTSEIPELLPLLQQYPAHLHIDIHPDFQRRGLGHRLMDALLAHLRDIGSPGIHLLVDKNNEKGMKFYHNYGFNELTQIGEAGDETMVFGRKI